MKRFFQFIRNKDVRHAALQKTFSRVVIGLLICFLWDRFLNSGGRLNVYGHAFMAVGLIYAALSWLNYLSLDGVNAPEIFKKKLFKKPPKRKMGDMIDYVDEKVVSFEELDDDERTAASFVANLIAAVLFLIPCIIFTLSK